MCKVLPFTHFYGLVIVPVLATMLAWVPSEADAATGSIRITITRAQFIVASGTGPAGQNA